MLGIVSDIADKIEPWVSPLWVAVGSASLLIIIVCALVLCRSRTGRWPAVQQAALIVLGAALSGSLTWACLAGVAMRNERNALEMRAQRLAAQTFATGTP